MMRQPSSHTIQTAGPTANRQGMALLFVISLILFLTLLGTSFVVVSQQFANSAKNRTRVEARGDHSRPLVQRAFYDILRGPSFDNADSVLLTHGIIEDMYGYGIAGDVSDVAAVEYAGNPGEYDVGGAIEFTLDTATLENLAPNGSAVTLSDIPGYYRGLVLSFTEGPLTGTSVRIIGYTGDQPGVYSGVTHTFTAYPEQSRDIPGTIVDINGNNVVDINETRVVINGRAYFGYGAGGLAGGGLGVLALSPNLAGQSLATIGAYVASGVNEFYDAPDYQNVWLTGLDPTGGVLAAFDRPQLYTSQGGTAGQNFRAFGTPGSGLHVDSDGDGTEDSIWIDAGYPVQTDIDGRRYKPLVAYMVVDMDGRLNVNAHGDLYDFDPDSDNVMNRAVVHSGFNLLGNVDPTLTQAGAPNGLPHGQYMGPPEISMAPLFGTGTAYSDLVFSRYGDDDLPGNANVRDAWQKYIQFGHPDRFHADEFYPNRFVGGLYGTALDIHGRYGRGISNQYVSGTSVPFGLPIADTATGLIEEDEIRNSPYEFSLIPQSRYALAAADYSDDQPFTAKEMERILRQFDRDSRMLPSRLDDLIGSVTTAADRHAFGHASFETPAIPGFDPDPALLHPVSGSTLEPAGYPVSINDRVHNLLLARGYPAASIDAMINELLSYESRMGLPFDINRPFGDGRDNDSDGVYDEIDELANNNEILTKVDGTTVSMDPDGDGNTGANSEYSRYVFAKQLYILALLVTGDTANGAAVIAQPLQDADTVRRFALAQWAINVVDFRDSDNINTPFEFDFDPFDASGWQADGDLTTVDPGSFVVWGCERPELLLMESVAFHDRRTQDLNEGGLVPTDPHYDSRLVPNPSVFIELYRPWASDDNEQLHPRELGATNASNSIDLLQESAAGHPVWRMVVSNEVNFSTLWRDVDARTGVEGIPAAEEFRRIYFVRPNAVVEPANRDKVYYPGAAVQGALTGNSSIAPGGYAVVGSSGTLNGSAYETWFGRRNTASWDTELPLTRGISLLPASGQVEVREGSPDAAATTFDAVAIPVNTTETVAGVEITRSLGVSDPRAGYYDYETLSDVISVADGYEFTSTQDLPVDTDPLLMGNSVKTTFRSVFLQRLADPEAPFDATSNPYLTIDRQAIDLTVFNGVTDDSDDPVATGTLEAFASNERGRSRNPDLTTSAATYSGNLRARRRLWPGEGVVEGGDIVVQSPIPGDVHHFDYEFLGSIGTVNLAYTHSDFDLVGAAPVGFAGLTWNNRPFSNHLELMDVPFTSTFDLLASRDLGSQVGYTLEKSIVSVMNPTPPTDPYGETVRGGWYGHLLNFFSPGTANAEDPEGLAGLLDFVRVPSRFAGTQIHVSPSQTVFPPFNVLSRYREPGKINVNTVFNNDVIDGWLGPHGIGFSVAGEDITGAPATWSLTPFNKGQFEGSRRSPALPTSVTRFDDPFRNANAYDKVPTGLPVNEPASVTLLRNDATGGVSSPIFNTIGNLPWADPERDSTLRFERFRRIGATTTTRSSVFAIWVTIGRFEVDENDNLATDGSGDGIELGADLGKAQRSRGFYMIDRSIPVACEPGVNHNVEKTILIETIID